MAASVDWFSHHGLLRTARPGLGATLHSQGRRALCRPLSRDLRQVTPHQPRAGLFRDPQVMVSLICPGVRSGSAASPAVSQYRGAGGDHPGHLRRLADPHQGNLPFDLPSAGEWRMGVMEIEQLYFGGSPNGQIQAVLADAA